MTKFVPDMSDPKLKAALVKLLAAEDGVRANPAQYNPRTRAARDAQFNSESAYDNKREAVDALCEILHKQRGDPS